MEKLEHIILPRLFCRVNQPSFSGWILWLIKESWHFLSAFLSALRIYALFSLFCHFILFIENKINESQNYFSLFVTYFFFSFLWPLDVSSFFLQRNNIFGLIQNNHCGFKLNYPDQMLILKNCLLFFKHFIQRISKGLISLTHVWLWFYLLISHLFFP